MIDLSLLPAFVAVVEEGGFTRGAMRTNASQSVVSRAVQRLEDQIGIRLLERSTRNVRMTPAGEAYFTEAKAALDRMAIAASLARRIGLNAHAELRIGICETTEASGLMRGIAAFREAWPELDVRFQPMLSPLQPQALRAGAIDVGIMQGGADLPADISCQLVARYGVILAVPRSWGYGEGPVRLLDFAERPWLMPDRSVAAEWHDGLVALCRNAGFEPRIVGWVNDPVSARVMISCGMGATFFHDKAMGNDRSAIQLLAFEDDQSGAPVSDTVVAWANGANSRQIVSLAECLGANSIRRL